MIAMCTSGIFAFVSHRTVNSILVNIDRGCCEMNIRDLSVDLSDADQFVLDLDRNLIPLVFDKNLAREEGRNTKLEKWRSFLSQDPPLNHKRRIELQRWPASRNPTTAVEVRKTTVLVLRKSNKDCRDFLISHEAQSPHDHGSAVPVPNPQNDPITLVCMLYRIDSGRGIAELELSLFLLRAGLAVETAYCHCRRHRSRPATQCVHPSCNTIRRRVTKRRAGNRIPENEDCTKGSNRRRSQPNHDPIWHLKFHDVPRLPLIQLITLKTTFQGPQKLERHHFRIRANVSREMKK